MVRCSCFARLIPAGHHVPWATRRPAAKMLEAHDGIRTRDLFLTKEVLYRLSYMGPNFIPDPGAALRGGTARFYLERETGFEPATPSLEGSRSTN